MTCSSFCNCSCSSSSQCPLSSVGCLEYKDTRPIASCNENNKKYTLQNTNYTIAKYHVDGGLIQGSINRCDYLFLCYGLTNQKAVFVELKGTNNDHACKQILDTIDACKSSLPTTDNLTVYARIINAKTAPNDLVTKNYRRLVKSLQNLNKSSDVRVLLRSVKYSENIASI